MTNYGSEVLPDDFFVDDVSEDQRITRTGAESELIEARDIALKNPNKWVRVGRLRWLYKDPSAWVSEVRTYKKAALQSSGGTFTACWWYGNDTRVGLGGQRQYGKAIMFVKDEAK